MRSILLFVTAATLVAAGRADQPPTATPTDQFARLMAEFDAIEPAFRKDTQADPSPEGRRAATEKRQKALASWQQQALALIRQYPAEPGTVLAAEKLISGNAAGIPEVVGILR